MKVKFEFDTEGHVVMALTLGAVMATALYLQFAGRS